MSIRNILKILIKKNIFQDLNSKRYIGGRSMVIHALGDNGNPTRQKFSMGASGARIACCKIAESVNQNKV